MTMKYFRIIILVTVGSLSLRSGRGAVFTFMHSGTGQRKAVGKVILADEKFANEDYQGAHLMYRELLEQSGDKDRDGELFFKGLLTQHILNPEDSTLASLETLPRKFPDSPWLPDLYRYVGDVKFRAGNFPLSADYYTRCLYHPRAAGAVLPGQFLLKYGYCLREVGADTAAFKYLAQCTKDNVMGDYILFWQAYCALKSGDLKKGIQLLEQIVDGYPGSILSDSTYKLLGSALQEQGADSSALGIYHRAVNEGLRGKAETWYRIGRIQEKLGRTDKALYAYLLVMKKYPAYQWGWKSRISLINLTSRLPRGLNEKEQFYNGVVLASQNQPREAIRVLQEFLDTYPESPFRPDALFLTGKAHYRLRNRPEGLECFNQVLEAHPQSLVAGDAMLYSARCLRRLKKRSQARKRYLRLAREFPGHPKATEALWNVAWEYELKKKYKQAAKVYQELATGFPKDRKGQEAAWRVGFCHYMDENLKKAETAFLRAQQVDQLYIQDQSWFWLGKLYEQHRQPAKADSAYKKAYSHFPRTFYSCRAAARLGKMPARYPAASQFKQGKGFQEAWKEAVSAFWIQYQDSLVEKAPESQRLTEDRLIKGMQLLSLDFRREAEREFYKLERTGGDNMSFLFELSRIYKENDLHYRAFRTQFRLLQLLHGEDSDNFPFKEMYGLYPLHYYDVIVGLAQQYPNLDPFLVLAIILQESRFHARAQSVANALGLMQLMPFTGRDMARLLRVEDYKTEMLFDPVLNIRLGMKYLSRQLDKWEGNRVFTLAAYNGGPTNVKRWIKRTGTEDMDLYVENIAFRETRKYVKIVSTNYWKYYELWKNVCLRK